MTAFLSDPSLVILGFGWDGADEAKMKSTFGIGKARFRRFIDLQVRACGCKVVGFRFEAAVSRPAAGSRGSSCCETPPGL